MSGATGGKEFDAESTDITDCGSAPLRAISCTNDAAAVGLRLEMSARAASKLLGSA